MEAMDSEIYGFGFVFNFNLLWLTSLSDSRPTDHLTFDGDFIIIKLHCEISVCLRYIFSYCNLL